MRRIDIGFARASDVQNSNFEMAERQRAVAFIQIVIYLGIDLIL